MMKCDPRAYAKCPTRQYCGQSAADCEFMEGSECDQFNQQVASHPMTNGDRFRATSDEELAAVIYGLINLDNKINFCKNKPECCDLLETEDGIPIEMCINCLCEWFQQPAEED